MLIRKIFITLFFIAVSVCSGYSGLLLIDDFNDGSDPTYMGREILVIKDDKKPTTIAASYVPNSKEPAYDGTGFSYKIDLNVKKASWAAVVFFISYIDISGYDKFFFYVKGKKGWEHFHIKFKDRDNKEIRFESNSLGVVSSGEWRKFEVKLSSLKKIDISKLSEVVFGFEEDIGSGYIMLDDIGFEMKGEQKVEYEDKYYLLNPCEDASDWEIAAHDEASLNVASTKGLKENCAEFKFNLHGKEWTVANYKVNKNLGNIEALRFYLKADAEPFAFKVKFVDGDGSIFGKIFNGLSKITEWVQITIPVKELEYWWGGDKTFNKETIKMFGFEFCKYKADAKGTVYIDEVQYKSETAVPVDLKLARTVNVTIDGFERSIPTNAYYIIKGDDSDLNLESSRDVVEGNYSMKLDYTLSTSRAEPTFVIASAAMKIPLNWKGVDDLNIWIKGDGSSNFFQVNLLDRSGEVFSYKVKNALLNTSWHLLKIPLFYFLLNESSKVEDGILNKEEIKRIEFIVIGERTEEISGSILLDEFYVTGRGIDPQKVAPPGALGMLVVPGAKIGNVDIGVIGNVEYRNTPERDREVHYWGKIKFDAKMNNFSARMEVTSISGEFGEQTGFDTELTLYSRKPSFELTDFSIIANNIHPNIRLITIGYLSIYFDRFTFGDWDWGYKGIKFEGDFSDIGYDLYLIKKRYSAYALASRFSTSLNDFNIKTIVVYNDDRAFDYKNTTRMDILDLTFNRDIEIRSITDDIVITTEIKKRYMEDRLDLRLTLGYDKSSKYGLTNVDKEEEGSDVYNPKVAELFDFPVDRKGNLFFMECQYFDFPFKAGNVQGQYRYIGQFFKPRFREGGKDFDDYWADQKGINLRWTQLYNKFNFNLEFDRLTRLSDSNSKRRKYRAGAGYYGFYGIDCSFTYEHSLDIYKYSEPYELFSTDKNERKDSFETYFNLRITDNIRCWMKLVKEIIRHPVNNNRKYHGDYFQSRLEYYISNNAWFFVELKKQRYGNQEWEEQEGDYGDNYFKTILEVSF